METTKQKKSPKRKDDSPIEKSPSSTPANPHLVTESEVDYKTRTLLLLDSRNDLVAYFFGGLDVMAANFKPSKKVENSYAEYLYITCQGFIETVREKSMQIMAKYKPEYGIGDIVKNGKGNRRLIINMHDDKDNPKAFTYSWVDPDDAKAPMGVCAGNTMRTWAEKR